MSLFPDPQPSFAFPQPLTEKYRPKRIADFVGLDKQKTILTKFAANPRCLNWLFVGESGMGKTTIALALAAEIQGELHHIPSQKCTVENIEDTVRMCWYATRKVNGFHIVLVDEADQMTDKAQLALLSKLDSTARTSANLLHLYVQRDERSRETLPVALLCAGFLELRHARRIGRVSRARVEGRDRPGRYVELRAYRERVDKQRARCAYGPRERATGRMIYRITITRVLRRTQWLVTLQNQSVAWGIGCLTLERARKLALKHVPAFASYTITYDTPRGIHDIGPFVR